MAFRETPAWHPSDAVSDAVTFDFVGWVAGATFGNRQRVIRHLRVGQQLQVVREPENPYDSQACALVTLAGEHVGYVPSEDASGIAESIDRGEPWIGYVGRVSPPGEIDSWGAYVWLGRPRLRRRTKESPDPTTLPPADWYADPTGRHRLRYWNGMVWMEYVSDDSVTVLDPLE